MLELGVGIEGAEAHWTVPSVQASSTALYSATWVGVDGWEESDLIQTGTEQDTSDGYYAWYQVLPQDPTQIQISGTVKPGDEMIGQISETSPDNWTIYLDDVTEGWYFLDGVNYDGPGNYAEWVEEAPTVSGVQQQSIADFGTVEFQQTGIYGDFGGSGTTWYGTDLSAANEVDLVNEANVLLAAPSAPTSDPSSGQDFVDTYESTPLKPPVVRIASPQNTYLLSADIPVVYAGTDATSPVASYDVRYEYARFTSRNLSGWVYPSSWQGTTSRRVTLLGHPGTQYCFSVRATSAAGTTSSWTSTDHCATLPVGARALGAATSGWSWHRAAGYYLDTYATTTTEGAELRLTGAFGGHVALVATRCPTCGVLGVFLNGRLLRTVNTRANRTVHGSLLYLPNFSIRHFTVELVNESAHARVIVEGLAVS